MRFIVPLLVSLLILQPALAQPTSQPTLLTFPRGTDVVVQKQSLRAYTLDEFKIILHIYTDYRSWGAQLPEMKSQINLLTELTQNQSEQLKLRAAEAKIYQDERKLLTEKYLNENKLRHECENKPNFGSWIAWGSAAAMGIVAAVLAGILIAKD